MTLIIVITPTTTTTTIIIIIIINQEDHIHGHLLLATETASQDLKKLSSSSSRTTSKKNESFRLQTGARHLGFLGAGGQTRAAGILCSAEVGVRHPSSSEMLPALDSSRAGVRWD